MGFTLDIPTPELPPNQTHKYTRWRVYKDKPYGELFYDSGWDDTNLTSIYIDKELEQNTLYYSTAQIASDTTTYKESEPTLIDPKIDTILLKDFPIPSFIPKPTITIKDSDNLNGCLIDVNISEMISYTNSKHIANTIVINKLNGEPVYYLKTDKNLTNKRLFEVILEDNEDYILTVIQHADTGDASEPVYKHIHVKDLSTIVLKSDTRVDTITDWSLVINPIENFKKLYYNIYDIELGEPTLNTSGESESLTTIISKDVFNTGASRWLLEISVELEDGTTIGKKYYYLYL